MASDDMMINELQRMWKEIFVAKFEALYRHLPGAIRENHKTLSQKSRFQLRDLNSGFPEYESQAVGREVRWINSFRNV